MIKTPPKIRYHLATEEVPKMLKGRKQGYRTLVLYLAPASLSGRNVCPGSTPGCRRACLNTCGRGQMGKVQASRLRKTVEYFESRDFFMAKLLADIAVFQASCMDTGHSPTVRLNGTSDLPWEKSGIIEKFEDIQFYDYTKIKKRMKRSFLSVLPDNYTLVWSHNERDVNYSEEVLEEGGRVAWSIGMDVLGNGMAGLLLMVTRMIWLSWSHSRP